MAQLNFEDVAWAPAAKRRQTRQDLDADDDVVFEVLRYAYCGTVHVGLSFHTRLLQLIAVVDYLGIDALTLLTDPAIERWLHELQNDALVGLLRDVSQAEAIAGKQLELGFQTRRALLTKLVQLRPQDIQLEDVDPALVVPSQVNLRIMSETGEIVADFILDWQTTVDAVLLKLRDLVGAPDTALCLVHGGEPLTGTQTLRELGPAVGSGVLSVIMAQRRLDARKCSCGNPAVRQTVTKWGPFSHLLVCSRPPGSKCDFIEMIGAGC